MPKAKKPVPPKKLSDTEKMIQDCVKKAQARKKSGQTDREWSQQYATSQKVEGSSPRRSSNTLPIGNSWRWYQSPNPEA